MIFRKEFVILGVIFGLCIYGSIAIPGGYVESTTNSTARIPTIENSGGVVPVAGFLMIGAGIMLATIIATSVVIFFIRQANLVGVAEAYGVDPDALAGMSPMEAAEMLNEKLETHNQIIESAK